MEMMSEAAFDQGPSTGWIEPADRAAFADVNRRPFGYRHSLHALSLFNLDEIMGLAQRLPDYPGFKAWQNGSVGASGTWDTRPGKWLPLDETLRNIAETDSVVVLKHAEQDPVFGPVLQELLAETFALAPAEFRDDVVLGECLIFVNSPNRKTVYHFDLEPSFLLQIAGEKTVHAWERDDRSLVPVTELEDYCGAGNLNAGVFKPERLGDAHRFHLKPGEAVHFPSTGPHLVESGAGVAISVNVNFDMRSMHHRLRYAYAINHHLRRLGLRPTDPGMRPWVDGLKAGLWQTARGAKRLARAMAGRSRPEADFPVWVPGRSVARSQLES